MLARLNRILGQFRDAGSSPLEAEAILQACRTVGYPSWRERMLGPVTTIQVFLLQILHGNTACAHLPHLALHLSVPSAVVLARRTRDVREILADLIAEPDVGDRTLAVQ